MTVFFLFQAYSIFYTVWGGTVKKKKQKSNNEQVNMIAFDNWQEFSAVKLPSVFGICVPDELQIEERKEIGKYISFSSSRVVFIKYNNAVENCGHKLHLTKCIHYQDYMFQKPHGSEATQVWGDWGLDIQTIMLIVFFCPVQTAALSFFLSCHTSGMQSAENIWYTAHSLPTHE